ncbi:MAG: HD domain-containing protein [Nanoarchaeota archaeon]
MIKAKILGKVKYFALEKAEKGDAFHNGEHIRRTVSLAKYLAKREGANLDVCIIAAWLHDIAQPLDEENHALLGEKMAEEFLSKEGFEKEFIEQIKHCIHCHETKTIKEAQTIEAKVIYDADKLHVLGPWGFIRSFSSFLTTKNKEYREALLKVEKSQKDRFENYLQTATAKKLIRMDHKLMVRFFERYDKFEKKW